MGFGNGQGGAIPVNMNDIGSVSAASVTRLDTCTDSAGPALSACSQLQSSGSEVKCCFKDGAQYMH